MAAAAFTIAISSGDGATRRSFVWRGRDVGYGGRPLEFLDYATCRSRPARTTLTVEGNPNNADLRNFSDPRYDGAEDTFAMTTDRLEDLLEIAGTGEFEDCGHMRLTNIHWSADRVDIRLRLDHGTGQASTWQLRFRDVLEQKFTAIDHCGLNVWRENHPAIDQYTQSRQFLHFGAAPAAPDEVVGRLWAAHLAVADDWIPFERYLNRELPLAELLAGGAGLLATGPAFLIEAYAAVVEKAQCMPTVNGLPNRTRLKRAVLTHFGDSYVISEEVNALRIAG
jgi:hypothetical protein